MKNRIPAILLCSLLAVGIAGCAAQGQEAAGEAGSMASEIIASLPDADGSSGVSGSEADSSTVAPEPSKTESEPPSAESEASRPAEGKNPETEPVPSSKGNAGSSASPPQSTPPKQNEPAKPDPVNPPAQEQKPEPPESSAPAFDIDYWIKYAQDYAQKVGLRLESSTTACWDNPIGANAKCKYLERDIQDRLNRYARDEEITDVWIWAESLGNGDYNLYIGYA